MTNKKLTLDEVKQINLSKLMVADVLTNLYVDVDYNSYSHYPMLIVIDKRNHIDLPSNNKLEHILSVALNKPIETMSSGYNQHMTHNINIQLCNKRLSSYTGIEKLSKIFRGVDSYGFNDGFNMPKSHYEFMGLLKYNIDKPDEFEYFSTNKHNDVYNIVDYLIKEYKHKESIKEAKQSLKDAKNKSVLDLYAKIEKLSKADNNKLYKLLSVKKYR